MYHKEKNLPVMSLLRRSKYDKSCSLTEEAITKCWPDFQETFVYVIHIVIFDK